MVIREGAERSSDEEYEKVPLASGPRSGDRGAARSD